MEKFKFTVKRSEWLRGEGSENSFLLRESDNKMCCLGFFCLAKGIPKDAFMGKEQPGHLNSEHHGPLVGTLLSDTHGRQGEVTDNTFRLMRANDRFVRSDGTDVDGDLYTPEMREANLKRLFAEINVEVEFID